MPECESPVAVVSSNYCARYVGESEEQATERFAEYDRLIDQERKQVSYTMTWTVDYPKGATVFEADDTLIRVPSPEELSDGEQAEAENEAYGIMERVTEGRPFQRIAPFSVTATGMISATTVDNAAEVAAELGIPMDAEMKIAPTVSMMLGSTLFANVDETTAATNRMRSNTIIQPVQLDGAAAPVYISIQNGLFGQAIDLYRADGNDGQTVKATTIVRNSLLPEALSFAANEGAASPRLVSDAEILRMASAGVPSQAAPAVRDRYAASHIESGQVIDVQIDCWLMDEENKYNAVNPHDYPFLYSDREQVQTKFPPAVVDAGLWDLLRDQRKVMTQGR